MNALIGTRVRLTVHDQEGEAHAADGVIVALAAQPGTAFSPCEPKPWDCIVRLDGSSGVVVYDVSALEILAEDTASAPDQSTEALQRRVETLDDECAQLTADLEDARKMIAELRRERESAPSKIAAVTKPKKS